MFLQMGNQLLGHTLLVTSADGKNHSPVTTLKVRSPCPSTFLLQKRFMLPAEFVQIRISRNHDLLRLRRGVARAARHDPADEVTVGRLIFYGLLRIKESVVKKLPGRSCYHETVQRISRWGLAFMGRPLAVLVVLIFPHQFVGVSEGILPKIKM